MYLGSACRLMAHASKLPVGVATVSTACRRWAVQFSVCVRIGAELWIEKDYGFQTMIKSHMLLGILSTQDLWLRCRDTFHIPRPIPVLVLSVCPHEGAAVGTPV
jgi:hypothetical protein